MFLQSTCTSLVKSPSCFVCDLSVDKLLIEAVKLGSTGIPFFTKSDQIVHDNRKKGNAWQEISLNLTWDMAK